MRLKEKIATLKKQVQWLKEMEVEVLTDQQVSLTDPDARSMATSGRGSGVMGYNVQAAVDTEHHLIVAHQVTRVGDDRAQLAPMASKAKMAMGVERLDVLADRGYVSGAQILACEKDKVTPFVPKPLTSGAKAAGRFGKQDFIYPPSKNVYRSQRGRWLGLHGRPADGPVAADRSGTALPTEDAAPAPVRAGVVAHPADQGRAAALASGQGR